VLKNDSFGAIAARVYKDENYSFVVKYFSGFDDNTQLIEGTELVLPVIGDEITGKIFHLNKELIKARSLYKNGEFEKLVIVAEKIFKHSSEEEASFLLNSAYCGFGEDLVKAGKLAEAIEVYSKVNPAFKNVDSKIENLKKLQLKKEKEAVAMAYSEYLSKGIALYENKNYFGALEMLNTVELDYLGIKELKEAIIRDMNAIGEQYYKEGVKLFIDEDLTGAIGQWKLALKYNPNHGKATKDIENAKGILEKINDIGKKP
jgi:tetratricopeptide (TPR) repeat protein